MLDPKKIILTQIFEGGGGGSSVEVEPLSITANGTYTAETGKAYSPVTANVPNSYAAGDEGKVVSNGALVSQTSTTITENGTVDTTLNNSVTVNVSGGGGSGDPIRDVNFYDYDGTIVKSYTAADFASVSALPDNPSHTGLTAQGWNWSLNDAKTFVSEYGGLDIGQLYVTESGKTELDIELRELLSPTLGLCINGTVDIDWGDGTSHSTATGSSLTTLIGANHTYASAGNYTIKIGASSGNYAIVGNTTKQAQILYNGDATSLSTSDSIVYRNSIVSVRIGADVSLRGDGFADCRCLESITLPKNSIYTTYELFNGCLNLKSVTLPAYTEHDSSANAFSACYTLESVSTPKGMSYYTQCFYQCYSLKKSVMIGSGNSYLGTQWASYARVLRDVVAGTTDTVNIGESAFAFDTALRSVDLRGTNGISKTAFNGCSSLEKVIIPSGVTVVAADAFKNCYSMKRLRFLGSTPPTASSSTSFSGLPTTCVIEVPTGSLASYTSASNYPSSSTYTYVEY